MFRIFWYEPIKFNVKGESYFLICRNIIPTGPRIKQERNKLLIRNIRMGT